ncbi:uncharacterized protein LOC120261708 [Dioscorea cayenensis subsp. rotundata]|uniref:Uncharacterized protein LOC120261708 n=1 Tax=Dioscorea cayennensis subsp. rotundata TaxID=55577 RepID=A0AB40BG65_DIOCR|nr:uncharacterized protein LOC120261708 [Dioscorea cayenensis subsp. rotundata]
MSAMVVTGETVIGGGEVEWAACECCGLREECTPAYIDGVRARHGGRWVCGLCSEAVKDEICRAGRLISPEEALTRHAIFREAFRSAGPPPDPAAHLIAAVRHIVRRGLESPRAPRSTPASPRRRPSQGGGTTALSRSGSCFSALAR